MAPDCATSCRSPAMRTGPGDQPPRHGGRQGPAPRPWSRHPHAQVSGPTGPSGGCATLMVIAFLAAFIALALWVLLERPQ